MSQQLFNICLRNKKKLSYNFRSDVLIGDYSIHYVKIKQWQCIMSIALMMMVIIWIFNLKTVKNNNAAI